MVFDKSVRSAIVLLLRIWLEHNRLIFCPMTRESKEGVTEHTAGSDTIFIQIYMEAPPGVPGVSKKQIFFFTNKTVEFLR